MDAENRNQKETKEDQEPETDLPSARGVLPPDTGGSSASVPSAYNEVKEAVEQDEQSEATAQGEAKEEERLAPRGSEGERRGTKKKRKIYEKEQCNLCGKWLNGQTLRWSHDCRKSKAFKRPNLTDVPLEPEKEEPTPPAQEPRTKTKKDRPKSPPPSPKARDPTPPPRDPTPPPPTMSELKLLARAERQARFASKMFG